MDEPKTLIGTQNARALLTSFAFLGGVVFAPFFFLGQANLTRAGYYDHSLHLQPYWLLRAEFRFFEIFAIVIGGPVAFGISRMLFERIFHGGTSPSSAVITSAS